MKRVLLTGMSATGKSAVIRELASRGFKAVDLDEPGCSESVHVPGEPGISAAAPGDDWQWREDRVRELLSTEDVEILFVGGCATNQGVFYPQFDQIILLSAPLPLMLDRLATRATNAYGKDPGELARVLEFTQTIEPLLRRNATLEIDTRTPLEEVVEIILDTCCSDDVSARP